MIAVAVAVAVTVAVTTGAVPRHACEDSGNANSSCGGGVGDNCDNGVDSSGIDGGSDDGGYGDSECDGGSGGNGNNNSSGKATKTMAATAMAVG